MLSSRLLINTHVLQSFLHLILHKTDVLLFAMTCWGEDCSILYPFTSSSFTLLLYFPFQFNTSGVFILNQNPFSASSLSLFFSAQLWPFLSLFAFLTSLHCCCYSSFQSLQVYFLFNSFSISETLFNVPHFFRYFPSLAHFSFSLTFLLHHFRSITFLYSFTFLFEQASRWSCTFLFKILPFSKNLFFYNSFFRLHFSSTFVHFRDISLDLI